MHKYYNNRAYMQGYYSSCIWYFISPSHSLFISLVWLSPHALVLHQSSLLSPLLIADGFDYLISVFVVSVRRWFWLMGLMILIRGYWSGWWWLGFDDFDKCVLIILIYGYWSGWRWLGFWWVGWWWGWLNDGGCVSWW